jgi:hypothetical protein
MIGPLRVADEQLAWSSVLDESDGERRQDKANLTSGVKSPLSL